jgi:hypothetical protein
MSTAAKPRPIWSHWNECIQETKREVVNSNLPKGLDELEKGDLIGKRDRTIIEAAIEAGTAAMHRGHQSTTDAINVAIDIVERMMHPEILEAKAKELAGDTPSRKRATAKRK